MKNVIVLIFALLIFGCSSSTVEFKVTVEAGPSDRIATPVSVEIPVSKFPSGTQVCVILNGKSYPAQIGSVGPEKIRIWWIVSNLSAGQFRNSSTSLVSRRATSSIRLP